MEKAQRAGDKDWQAVADEKQMHAGRRVSRHKVLRQIIDSILSESMEGINAEIVIARARVIQTTEGSSYQESSRS